MFAASLLFKRTAPLSLRFSTAMPISQGSFFMGNQSQKFFSNDNRAGGADEASDSDFQPKSKVPSSDEVTEHISTWIKENDVCVFMKGTRKMPQCGFSRYVVVLMNAYGVKEYKDVNVLADDTLRNTIKEYSNWPTIPQIYIKGEFVGGCDIMKEMYEDGTLRELLITEKIIKE